jgi:NAD(P) transhydrogenase
MGNNSGILASVKVSASALNDRTGPGKLRKIHIARAIKAQRSDEKVWSLTRPRPLFLQRKLSEVPTTAVTRYATQAAEPNDGNTGLPYSGLTIGVPKESYPGERRVAITPHNVVLLFKKGFSQILIERGAGIEAQFTDEAYELAGAESFDRKDVFSDSHILLKVRALSIDGPEAEVDAIRDGATVISFLYPVQNKPVVDRIASRNATVFAMDMVPRISRAQVFDALRYATQQIGGQPSLTKCKLHGEHCWLQSCSGSFKHIRSLLYWPSHCCWKNPAL